MGERIDSESNAEAQDALTSSILTLGDVVGANLGSDERDGIYATREIDEFYENIYREVLTKGNFSQGKVISLYGIGGQGKSVFMGKLYDRLLDDTETDRIIVLTSDLKGKGTSKDRVLKEFADSLEAAGVSCRTFAMTYYRKLALAYGRACAQGDFWEDQRRRDLSIAAFDSVAAENQVNTEVMAALIGVAEGFLTCLVGFPPVAGMAGSMLVAANALSEEENERLKRNRLNDEWDQICQLPTQEAVSAHLEESLKKDISFWSEENKGSRIVFLVDTFESIKWESSLGDRASKDRWMRVLTQAPATLWILAGRNRVSWENVVQYPLLFVEMNEDEAKEYLAKKGVTDQATVDKILKLTGCLPIYLDMCVEIAARNADVRLGGLSDIDENRRLPAVYLSYLNPEEQTCVYAGAFLGRWDRGNIRDALEGYCANGTAMATVGALSFVTRKDGFCGMHDTVAEILRESCENEELMEVLYANVSSILAKTRGDKKMPAARRIQKIGELLGILCRIAEVKPRFLEEDQIFDVQDERVRHVQDFGDPEAAL